jgi:hypothetical protein
MRIPSAKRLLSDALARYTQQNISSSASSAGMLLKASFRKALSDHYLFVRKEAKIMVLGDDLLMLRDGKMLILQGQEMIDLQKELLLVDGTRIVPDGRVILVDGTYQALKEGQAILVDSRGIAS